MIKGKNLKAKELLEMLQENCKNFEYKTPINLDTILECLKVKLNRVIQYNEVLGEIEIKDNIPIITINSANHLFPERERFTIAHELGHLCRHIAPKNQKKFVDTENTMKRNGHWSLQEYEANNFAARLLMPADLIEQEGIKIAKELEKKGDIDIDEFIERMAQKFEVSKLAMRFRLKNLGILN